MTKRFHPDYNGQEHHEKGQYNMNKYIIDHDLHIHSRLSSCSNDPEQTVEALLRYAENNGLSTICITDHFWDEKVPGASDWYKPQNMEHITKALPLPQGDKVRFLFGCETDQDQYLTVGVAPENYDKFDFIIIPTTHLHMSGFTCCGDEGVKERADLYISRLDAVLNMNLPFEKVGIAHLTCGLMYPGHYLEVLQAIPDSEFRRLFDKAASVGVGIELNFDSIGLNSNTEEREITLRPYFIAKEAGCKFYFGSDAHQPQGLAKAKANFENIVELLSLEESDKFILPTK